MSENAVTPSVRPWRRAAAWLLFLGPFFFATYGLATWLTTQRAHVGSIVFGWEHAVPFVPWTIVPYWAIDALYGISLFVCADKSELDTHAKRLLTAQVAVALSGRDRDKVLSDLLELLAIRELASLAGNCR